MSMNQVELEVPKKGIFSYFYQDAVAGIITGMVAVPLSVGICMMSDYPVYLGLYTVILAGVMSFVISIFRPGNYTGMPGVAAGLAPALALGVHSFGMENMPFVIFITAIIQAFVWKMGWAKYILRTVPIYLIEGLLAGVGLKIASKFLPDVMMESLYEWVLMLLCGIIFVWAFQRYKRYPAVPYILLMVCGGVVSFVASFPTLTLEDTPFSIALPMPHIVGTTAEVIFVVIKMIGFAFMLASIDIIEQIMSNIGIEEIDPLRRKTDSNNSLLAIWIINIMATFFGGMTNLDGLVKSTTNTIAGAKTKLSNLFTSLVLLSVVMFPDVVLQTPLFVFAMIMLFSGWSMVKKITQAHHHGRYPFLLSIICMVLVFSFGIFEGLLIVLIAHAGILILEERVSGKTNAQIWNDFRMFIRQPSEKEFGHLRRG